MAGRPKRRKLQQQWEAACAQARAEGKPLPPMPQALEPRAYDIMLNDKPPAKTDEQRAEQQAKLMQTWQHREECVVALLANPEMSLRDLKSTYSLKLGVSTLGNYRRKLKKGEEPWMTGPGGGGVPSSRAARGSVHARQVADGLRRERVAAGFADPVTAPGTRDANPLRPQDKTIDDGLTEAERGFREDVAASAGVRVPVQPKPAPRLEQVDMARPHPAGDDGSTPRDLRREVALQRRKLLEGMNLMAGKVGLNSLKILDRLLNEREQKLKVRDVAVVGSIAMDKFISTSASLEDLTGESGVPGTSDYMREGGDKKLLDARTRDEKSLKRLLRLVKGNQTREATDAPGDESLEPKDEVVGE